RMTRLAANSRPMSIRMSRARLAGKTFTSSSVTPLPTATGMTANGTTVSTARTAHTHQDRDEKEHHHPRRLTDRAQEARVEQPPCGDRRREQESQILR